MDNELTEARALLAAANARIVEMSLCTDCADHSVPWTRWIRESVFLAEKSRAEALEKELAEPRSAEHRDCNNGCSHAGAHPCDCYSCFNALRARADAAESSLAAITRERDGLLTQVEYERNEVRARQSLRELAGQELAAVTKENADLRAAVELLRERLMDMSSETCGLVHDGTECCLAESGIEGDVDELLALLPAPSSEKKE